MIFEEFKIGFLYVVGMEKVKLFFEEYVEKMYLRYKWEKEEYLDLLSFGKGMILNYSWFEEDEGVMVVFVLIFVKMKKWDVVSKLLIKCWSLGLKGCVFIIDGEFYGNVCFDEFFWMFDLFGLLVMMF